LLFFACPNAAAGSIKAARATAQLAFRGRFMNVHPK